MEKDDETTGKELQKLLAYKTSVLHQLQSSGCKQS